jgi:hypothetical protein
MYIYARGNFIKFFILHITTEWDFLDDSYVYIYIAYKHMNTCMHVYKQHI